MTKQIKDYTEETTPVSGDLLIAQKASTGETIKVPIQEGPPDDSITGDAIDFTTTGEIWWEELGREEADEEVDFLELTFAARKYLNITIEVYSVGSVTVDIAFNGDNGSGSYSRRYSNNGSSTQTNINMDTFAPGPGTSSGVLASVMQLINVAAQEKLGIIYATATNNTGVANVVTRRNAGIKWANTSVQITSLRVQNNNSGGYAAGSRVIVRGHD